MSEDSRKPVILLDAGHGGQDFGAIYQERREADDNLKLALAVGALLEEAGYPVLYTRTRDLYQSPYEKAMIANDSQGEFLVSFHRNSGVNPGQYQGVQALVYSHQGQAEAVAWNIVENLAELGFQNIGVEERKDLVILRRTRIPAVLLETGFINSEEDNQIFDEEFTAVAQAIAAGIQEGLMEDSALPVAQTSVSQEGQMSPLVYYVDLGLWMGENMAVYGCEKLKAAGFPVYRMKGCHGCQLGVGQFDQLEEAVFMEQLLRCRRYKTTIRCVPREEFLNALYHREDQ